MLRLIRVSFSSRIVRSLRSSGLPFLSVQRSPIVIPLVNFAPDSRLSQEAPSCRFLPPRHHANVSSILTSGPNGLDVGGVASLLFLRPRSPPKRWKPSPPWAPPALPRVEWLSQILKSSWALLLAPYLCWVPSRLLFFYGTRFWWVTIAAPPPSRWRSRRITQCPVEGVRSFPSFRQSSVLSMTLVPPFEPASRPVFLVNPPFFCRGATVISRRDHLARSSCACYLHDLFFGFSRYSRCERFSLCKQCALKPSLSSVTSRFFPH